MSSSPSPSSSSIRSVGRAAALLSRFRCTSRRVAIVGSLVPLRNITNRLDFRTEQWTTENQRGGRKNQSATSPFVEPIADQGASKRMDRPARRQGEVRKPHDPAGPKE